jgi:hypothetical protein
MKNSRILDFVVVLSLALPWLFCSCYDSGAGLFERFTPFYFWLSCPLCLTLSVWLFCLSNCISFRFWWDTQVNQRSFGML